MLWRNILPMRKPGILTHWKETIAEFMENSLDAELDDELGHRKFDYRNKNTDNSLAR